MTDIDDKNLEVEEAGEATAAEVGSEEKVADSGEKRTFKAEKPAPEKKKLFARRKEPAGLGPTDDIPEKEAEREAAPLSEEGEDETGADKLTYRAEIGDYEEAKPEGDPVFKYKKEEDEKKSPMVKVFIGLAAVLLIVMAAALIFPNNNPVTELINRVFSSSQGSGKEALSIDGESVGEDMYLHFLLTAKAQIDSYAPGYFEAYPEQFEDLKLLVEDELKLMKAREQMAKEQGISLAETELAEIDGYIEETKLSYNSDTEYTNALTTNNLTEEVYRELLVDQMLYSKLLTAAASLPEYGEISDADFEAFIEEKTLMRAKHILFLTGEDEETNLAKLALAEEVLAQIRAGADFDELMLQYTEDPGIDYYPDGYTFYTGEMVPEFEQGVLALEYDEVSEPVQSSSGYHIIKRLAPDYAELRETIIKERLDAHLKELADAMQLKYSRSFDSLEDCVWPYSVQNVSSPEETAAAEPEGEAAGNGESANTESASTEGESAAEGE